MGEITTDSMSVYRDFTVDGESSSGAYDPPKTDIRTLFSIIDNAVSAIAASTLSYSTRALLYADLTRADGTLAYVYADSTSAYNTYYQFGAYTSPPAWVVATWYINQVATVVQPLVDDAAASATSAAASSASAPVTIGGTGSISINLQTLKITTSGSLFALTGSPPLAIPAAQSYTMTAPNPAFLQTIYVNVTTGNFGSVQSGSVPAGCRIVAFVFNQILYPVATFQASLNLTLTNSSGATTSAINDIIIAARGASDLPTVVGPPGVVTVNLQTGYIVTSAGNFYAVCSTGFKQITASQSVAITGFTNAAFLQTIYVNMSTGAVGAVQGAGGVPVGCLPVAYTFNQILYPAASYSPAISPFSLVNSAGTTISAAANKPFALIFDIGAWNVSMQTNAITTVGSCFLATPDGTISVAGSQTVTIPTMTGAGYLYANASGVLFYIDNGAPPAGSYPILALKQAPGSALDVQCLSFGANVTFTDSTGYTTTVGNVLKAFVRTSTRLILPDDMFFVSGLSLPLYKSSAVCETDAVLYNSTRTAVISGVATDRSPYQYFSEYRDLLGDNLAGTFQVGLRNWTDDNVMVQSVTRHLAGAGALTGHSPKILVIGDSTSEFGMLTELDAALRTLGATPVWLGTYASTANPANVGGGNIPGEGRGAFALRTFIGRDGVAATTNVATVASSGGGTTTHYQNPFLRVCVSGDLTAHPERCMRYLNAGTPYNQFRNVTYAEETAGSISHSATTDYYIFDFAAYLSGWGISTPDMVIIALDDNDVLWGGGPGGSGSHTYTQAEQLAFASASLAIMVRSIYEANPAIKVGISPLASRGNDTTFVSRWASLYAPLIEAQMTEVRALQTALSSTVIKVIGTWAHTNRDFPFPHTTSTALSASNDSLVQNVSDNIHWSTDATQLIGKAMVANVWAAYVACQVAGV